MGKVRHSFGSAALSLDLFGQGVGFSVNGKGTFKSFIGLVFSIGILATVLPFGLNKFIKCMEHSDTLHQESISQGHVDLNKVQVIEGFNVAVVLLDKNYLPLEIEDI